MMSDHVLMEVYKHITADAHLESVMLAGMGEPLLHGKVTEIVQKVSSAGKKAEILTNATLLNEKLCDELIDAGLDILWVSLDDAHTENITDFDMVIKNIKYFNGVRGDSCRLGFTFVATKPDITEIKELARKFSCDEINISGEIPSEPTESICSLNAILNESEALHKNYCPFVGEEKCFIKWNGDISPCMQLLHNSYTYLYEEKRKVSAYSFGNLLSSSLEQIWNSDKYVAFRERVKNFEFPDCTLCDGCDDRLENKSDCMFNEMPTCGACLWAQNIARCP